MTTCVKWEDVVVAVVPAMTGEEVSCLDLDWRGPKEEGPMHVFDDGDENFFHRMIERPRRRI